MFEYLERQRAVIKASMAETETNSTSRTIATHLVVIAGPPCAGKSTLSRAVARNYAFRRLEMDAILSRLIPQSDRRESDRLIAYRAMLLTAAELLSYAHSVVIDATFTSPECRNELKNCAAESGAKVRLIQCRIAPEVAVSRFRRRTGHSAVDLDRERVRLLAEEYPYEAFGLILDTDVPLRDCLKKIDTYLNLDS